MLVELVENTISEYNMLEYGDNVLLGVSGGHDSVALLHALNELSKEKKYKLHIAHINHGVRGLEADQDEDYVYNLSKLYGLPFYSKKADMEGYAKIHRLSSEEAGREIRYQFFREIVKNEMKSGKIAVAHNKNDQAETVIMRIIRGTGLDGLKGMDFVNNDIIRPLLRVSRHQIEKYCDDNNLEPRVDSTNLENIYARNKVRLELIPYIEDNFNPNLIDTIVRMSDIIREDSGYIQNLAGVEYGKVVIDESEKSITIDNSAFKALDKAVKNRIIRIAVSKVLGDLEGIEQKHLNSVIELSNASKTGKSINLIKSTVAKTAYDKLTIEKSEKKDKISYNYKVEAGQDLVVPEIKGKFTVRVLERDKADIRESNGFKQYFDYDKIEESIYIRNRLPGDKVKLLGMKGRKKLKDYYIDAKVPKEKRDIIPLVVIDGEIAWIVGYRACEKAKVTSQTKRVLMLEYLEDKN